MKSIQMLALLAVATGIAPAVQAGGPFGNPIQRLGNSVTAEANRGGAAVSNYAKQRYIPAPREGTTNVGAFAQSSGSRPQAQQRRATIVVKDTARNREANHYAKLAQEKRNNQFNNSFSTGKPVQQNNWNPQPAQPSETAQIVGAIGGIINGIAKSQQPQQNNGWGQPQQQRGWGQPQQQSSWGQPQQQSSWGQPQQRTTWGQPQQRSSGWGQPAQSNTWQSSRPNWGR